MLKMAETEGFQWDQGNIHKSRLKHGVLPTECEEVFQNIPLILLEDSAHSQKEERFYAMGQTNAGRLLFTVFTTRNTRVRVISSRDMNKKERKIYEKSDQTTEETSSFQK